MPNAHDVFARHLNLLRKCGNKSFVLLLAQSFDGHQSFGREMGSRHAGAHDAHHNAMTRSRARSRISTPTAQHLRAAVASAT